MRIAARADGFRRRLPGRHPRDEGLKILGEPDLSIVAFGSDEFDVFRVAEMMSEKGWLGGLMQKPKGIHRMMSMFHEPVLDEYLDDLRAAVGVVRQAPPSQATVRASHQFRR